ncbi:MAG: cysteine desulfurase [Muribaculaceae bacterium]|nr:cysteine desulfurase [Muribaculaceae bacterium]
MTDQFPILQRQVNSHRLVYLDNAATSLTPEAVVNAIADFYRHHNANVHRGVHSLSQEATTLLEDARRRVAAFINAPSPRHIVFTRGTTEAINLVASSLGQSFEGGDEVIVTAMEHHSNIVPWQLINSRCRVRLRVVPLLPDGSLDMDALDSLFNDSTRLVAVTHVSNVLGTVNPVERITAIAHSHGVPVLVDGAQAVAHRRVDVQAIDCDFYAFSAHKMYGPMGAGVLYGKNLDKLPPYQGGGEMVDKVTMERTTYQNAPLRFEAGTPSVADIVALPAAINWIESVSWEQIHDTEQALLTRATAGLEHVPGLHILGTAPDKDAVLSFVINGTSSYDIGVLLDQQGVAVRTGHHCAEPLMARLGIDGCVRASFAPYNTVDDVDALVNATMRAASMLR